MIRLPPSWAPLTRRRLRMQLTRPSNGLTETTLLRPTSLRTNWRAYAIRSLPRFTRAGKPDVGGAMDEDVPPYGGSGAGPKMEEVDERCMMFGDLGHFVQHRIPVFCQRSLFFF
ncbi:hypothetical protein ACFX2J_041151 [Malus domestica]